MTEKGSTYIAFESPKGKLRITPPLYFGNELKVRPDDLEKFAPTGTGLYGLKEHPKNRMKEGPIHEPAGGTIFFGNNIKRGDFLALSRILEIPERKDYAAFVEHSKNPGEEGYLTQLRLLSVFCLRYLFHAISDQEYESFQEQKLTMPEALYAFTDNQRKTWGTFFRESPKLEGKFGGDGHYAREELSFGLMIENDYFNVYRIWSRVWLVTK